VLGCLSGCLRGYPGVYVQESLTCLNARTVMHGVDVGRYGIFRDTEESWPG
jgi:hypothetical protein